MNTSGPFFRSQALKPKKPESLKIEFVDRPPSFWIRNKMASGLFAFLFQRRIRFLEERNIGFSNKWRHKMIFDVSTSS